MMPTSVLAVDDADAAEGLGRHHRDRAKRQRDFVAGVHQVAHEFEHGAEPSAPMNFAKSAR
jgi:hypothetical protein